MTSTLRLTNRTMTVADLIASLKEFDADTPVVFACDYGDRCNTQQVLPLVRFEEHYSDNIEESGYSQSGYALKYNEYDDYVDASVGNSGRMDPPVSILVIRPGIYG